MMKNLSVFPVESDDVGTLKLMILIIKGKIWIINDFMSSSGGEVLNIWLLDNQVVDTFGRKSTARHKIYQLLESS